MSASPIKNSFILSNAKTYIIPVLIVVAGLMIAMGNWAFSQAATTSPPIPHNSVVLTPAYHISGPATGGSLK